MFSRSSGLRLLASSFFLVIGLAPAGCSSDPTTGYSAQSIYPQNVSSIAVPIFENRTYVRDVEFELTDALVKEIEARTPYKVTSSSRADTMLTGQIRKVELDQLSKSPHTGLTEEAILSVTIDFEWKDLRNGRTLVERRQYTGHALFVPSRPSSEPIELGQFAVVQQLARDMVGELQAEW